jgi:hypothetical protein
MHLQISYFKAMLFFTPLLLILPFSSFKKTPPVTPEGYAVIVAVPVVNNNLLHNEFKLPKDVVFSNLPGTIKDAQAMVDILKSEGFKNENIIRLGFKPDDKVTAESIIAALNTAGIMVKKNGSDNNLFVFYYSGHGHQIKDQPGGDEKKDGLDEVLVANNGYVLDDKINELYKKYFSNTRNVMMVDACHAGSLHEFFKKKVSGKEPVKCRVTTETNVDEAVNMLYYGASLDENLSTEKNGGIFTNSIEDIYTPMQWKTLKPKDLACLISLQMQQLNDPGHGMIQYSELGKLTDDFKNDYLFKIK